MKSYAAQFVAPHVDIDLPDGLNTEQLREWLIRKIEEIDVQRKRYQNTLQRYSNTTQGKKQYTPEQIAIIRTEQTVLYEQRSAYRTLLGDLKAANKELSKILNNQKTSRQFSEFFVAVAKDMLSAEDFNRIFSATLERTA